MDIWLFMILAAACVCGSYKNTINQQPTFKGNFASVEDKPKPSTKATWPYYVTKYPVIGDNRHFSSKSMDLVKRSGMLN